LPLENIRPRVVREEYVQDGDKRVGEKPKAAPNKCASHGQFPS
jgi:hypothetical protein